MVSFAEYYICEIFLVVWSCVCSFYSLLYSVLLHEYAAVDLVYCLKTFIYVSPLFLDISNNAAICQYCEYIWCLYTQISVECIVRSEIARSWCICIFNFSTKCPVVFQCAWISSHPIYPVSVPVAPRTHQQLIRKVFSVLAILGGCVVYFILVFICIFLITNEVECLLIYLLVILLSCYFFRSSLYILDIRPLIITCVKIIFYSVAYLLTLDEVFSWIENFTSDIAQYINNFLYG